MFKTTLTIPTRQLREFAHRMSLAGYTVVDTGLRVTTDDGVESEATVRLLHVQTVEIMDPAHCELGVSA